MEPRPSLVPLRSSAQWVQALAGVSLQDCELFLRDDHGDLLARRRRPLLFTHLGISGPGPMDLSGLIAAMAASWARLTASSASRWAGVGSPKTNVRSSSMQ